MSVCVFCSKKSGAWKDFSDQTLEKAHFILKVRKNHGLQYTEVILPSVANDSQKYHVPCYRQFTAVKKKYTNSDKLSGSDSASNSST